MMVKVWAVFFFFGVLKKGMVFEIVLIFVREVELLVKVFRMRMIDRFGIVCLIGEVVW